MINNLIERFNCWWHGLTYCSPKLNGKLIAIIDKHPKFIKYLGPFEEIKYLVTVRPHNPTDMQVFKYDAYMIAIHVKFGDGAFWVQYNDEGRASIVQIRAERPNPHFPIVGWKQRIEVRRLNQEELAEVIRYATEAQTMEKLAS